MKNIKNELSAKSGTESEIESVDAGRRQALARLGLTAAIAYAAPALLPLRQAVASSGPGGGSGGNDSGGNDGSSGNDGSGGDDNGSGGNDDGSGGNGDQDDGSNPTTPSEATSPSEQVE